MERKVTVPFAPCVTEANCRAAFSKLSAEPPPAPDITLALTSVSSLVVRLSTTVSTTGVSVMVVVSVSEPVLGEATPSVLTIVKGIGPL